MKQRSTILVIAAGLVVVGFLFVMKRLLTEASAPVEVESSTPSVDEPASPPTAPVTPGVAAPRSAEIPQAPRPVPDQPGREPAPSLAPSEAESGPEPGSPENTTNLHFGKPALREQIAAVEPQLVECTQRASRAGHKPTGTAALTFILAMQGDKVVVETTGYDHDDTTIDQPELVECLQETARAMKFEGLPREARAISVKRRVGVTDGALTENALVDFSYIR